jgi:hypothetical protein
VGFYDRKKIGGGDEGLVGEVDEDGVDGGISCDRVLDAGAEGGAHAGFPEGVGDDLEVEAFEGGSAGVGLVAEDDGHGEVRGEGGIGGVADEGLAPEGEELLADAHAGGSAGGEED